MSLSTTQYGYIVDPMVPFTDDKGKTIKNGFIRVFMAGTSTPVITYRNYDGATNQEKIELDNSGRVKHNVIGFKGSLYKVVVYNILHSQENPLLTVDKIAVLGASINATGATIVTGLDSVTVQEENFLKATVEGTGVELSLDPTEVTSEVSTIGAAETAAPDYVAPLLDKTGTGDGKKISLANLFKFALDWISRLATTITSFASGDFIAVSNTTDGSRKMSKDTLLQLTSQNALAKILPAFDPNKSADPDTGFAYDAGESVIYNGEIKMFVKGHTGAWVDADAISVNLPRVFYTAEVTQRLLGNRLDDSEFTKTGWFLGNNGNPTSYADFGESGKCPCIPGEYLSFYVEGAEKPNRFYRDIVFFDSNKKFLSNFSVDGDVRRQLVPKNAFYFSIPIYYLDGVMQNVTAAGFVPTCHLPYSSSCEKIKSAVDSVYVPKNILDPSAVTTGGYISGINGTEEVWTTNSNYAETDFIDVRGKMLFTWLDYESEDKNCFRNLTVAYYNENKELTHVSGIGSSRPEILNGLVASTAYVRLPILISRLNSVAYGYERFNRFVPFGYKPKVLFDIDVLDGLGDSHEKPISQNAVTQALAAITPSGSQWNGKKWYAYGTSITNTNAEGRYATYLAQLSGMLHTNKGISGGGIGNLGAYSQGQVFNAICNTSDGKTEADLITLETGANDCNADVPLGTIYDTTQDTLAGCLNLCIRYLQANTNAQIAIMPSVATTTEPNETNQYYKWQLMIRDICTINRVFFIEPACNLGYGKLTGPNGTLYRVDTIHQTNLGGYILAEAMWEQIKRIPNFRTTMPT